MIRPWFRQAAVPWKTTATQTRASGENRVSTKPGVLHDAAAGGAPVAGGGGPDGVVRAGGAEGGERAGQAVGSCAGEAGECAQGAGGCGDEHVVLGAVVAVADLRGEPGGQDGQYLGEGEVAGVGEPGQVGDERFPGDRGDWPWQHWRVPGRAGYPGQDLRRVFLRGRWPVARW